MPLPDPNAGDLLRDIGKFLDLAEVTTFEGHRTRMDGSDAIVAVKVYDRGVAATATGVARYYAVATDLATGAEASGNPADSVRTVLGTLHWEQLG